MYGQVTCVMQEPLDVTILRVRIYFNRQVHFVKLLRGVNVKRITEPDNNSIYLRVNVRHSRISKTTTRTRERKVFGSSL